MVSLKQILFRKWNVLTQAPCCTNRLWIKCLVQGLNQLLGQYPRVPKFGFEPRSFGLTTLQAWQIVLISFRLKDMWPFDLPTVLTVCSLSFNRLLSQMYSRLSNCQRETAGKYQSQMETKSDCISCSFRISWENAMRHSLENRMLGFPSSLCETVSKESLKVFFREIKKKKKNRWQNIQEHRKFNSKSNHIYHISHYNIYSTTVLRPIDWQIDQLIDWLA